MSIRVMTTVWADAPYEGGSLLVLLALADWADDAGYCFPKVPAIAKKSRLTERQVHNILRGFRKDGTLLVEHGGGRGVPNRYHINPEKFSLKSVSLKSEAETLKSTTKNPEICDRHKGRLIPSESTACGEKCEGNRHYPSIEPSSLSSEPAGSDGDSGKRPENPPLGLSKGLGSKHSEKFSEDKTRQHHPEPYEDFDGSEWALQTFKAYPTWGDMEATVAPVRLGTIYMETIEAEAPSRGGPLKTAQWFLEVTREFAKQSAGKEPQFIMGLEKFLRQGYAEVKIPRSNAKYIPKESDEDCETRLREEARERRRAAREVPATV